MRFMGLGVGKARTISKGGEEACPRPPSWFLSLWFLLGHGGRLETNIPAGENKTAYVTS